MRFTKEMWIYGVWQVGNDNGNWMGALWREAGGKIVWEYRFRYYEDDKAFDSEDEESKYRMTMPAGTPIEKALTAIQTALPLIEQQYGSKADFVNLQCHGDDPKVLFEIGSRPWAHVKRMKG